MIAAYFTGLLLGAGLIIAIGAQNAFILRQGIAQSHVFALCLFCALSDSVLIALGVLGFGVLIKQSEPGLFFVTIFGALFLIGYGFLAMKRAVWPQVMQNHSDHAVSLKTAVLTCLALTFLNPHVYLDTVIFLGGISSNYPANANLVFGLGAATASFIWFFALGFGARILVPFFQKPRSWQILDAIIALGMWMIAAGLINQIFQQEPNIY